MSLGCNICKRPFRGSAIPKSSKAAKRPLLVSVMEEISRGPCDSDYKTLKDVTICIDCRPEVENRLLTLLRGLEK